MPEPADEPFDTDTPKKDGEPKERVKFLKEPEAKLTGKQKRMVDAAAMVLADAIEPMTVEAIMDAVFERELYDLPYSVANPARGLNSVIGREIATKGEAARFVMVDKHTYAYAG